MASGSPAREGEETKRRRKEKEGDREYTGMAHSGIGNRVDDQKRRRKANFKEATNMFRGGYG